MQTCCDCGGSGSVEDLPEVGGTAGYSGQRCRCGESYPDYYEDASEYLCPTCRVAWRRMYDPDYIV